MASRQLVEAMGFRGRGRSSGLVTLRVWTGVWPLSSRPRLSSSAWDVREVACACGLLGFVKKSHNLIVRANLSYTVVPVKRSE